MRVQLRLDPTGQISVHCRSQGKSNDREIPHGHHAKEKNNMLSFNQFQITEIDFCTWDKT